MLGHLAVTAWPGLPVPRAGLSAGRLAISWDTIPGVQRPGAQQTSGRPLQPTLIATGTGTFAAAGTINITIKPTRAGRRLLKHPERLKLTARGTFTAPGRRAVTARAVFNLPMHQQHTDPTPLWSSSGAL